MLRLPRIRSSHRAIWASPYCAPQLASVVLARMSSTSSRPLHIAPSPEEEETILQSDIAAIEEWWRSPRWEGIKRPYSARDVATKRGTLAQAYPSSTMAKKLFSLLSEKAEKGLPVHTSAPTPALLSRTSIELLLGVGEETEGVLMGLLFLQWVPSTRCR